SDTTPDATAVATAGFVMSEFFTSSASPGPPGVTSILSLTAASGLSPQMSTDGVASVTPASVEGPDSGVAPVSVIGPSGVTKSIAGAGWFAGSGGGLSSLKSSGARSCSALACGAAAAATDAAAAAASGAESVAGPIADSGATVWGCVSGIVSAGGTTKTSLS